ncbi:MAG: SDR family NAD(P)-dependent oxidoreductase [Proteobacteria bacterium]|jgi:NAD(P)-dependent dehydrogenase (short-subunit alcohol dehydrogenase family)|nr:SDR family NAD(P)-dependent oxidoreductase [Pseudomonadota bacterium]
MQPADPRPVRAGHALVTGGGRGMGVAIAAALARRGCSISLLGRTAATLGQTAQRLADEHGVPVHHALADIADEAAVAAAVAACRERLGPVSVLVNNAGIAPSAPFLASDTALWRRVLDVDLMGAVHATRAVLPDMLEAGRGRIVNIASTAALTGMAYVSAYCAAKHALLGFTRALAIEMVRKGITVNAICPGYADTDIVADAIANITAKTGRSREEALASLLAHNPQRRLVQPDEIGETVAWLCSDAAASVTGQGIVLAGGELMP